MSILLFTMFVAMPRIGKPFSTTPAYTLGANGTSRESHDANSQVHLVGHHVRGEEHRWEDR
jgi:hypothetical protein